jgi:hypothetical protein
VKPQYFSSRAHQHYTSLHIPFLQSLCQFSSARPKSYCRLSSSAPATLGLAVGSRHQTPLALTNPGASFSVPYSCSSTPCCPPIAAGAPLPTSAAIAALSLTMGSSHREFLRHINTVQLHDLFMGSLVPCIAFPMLAGVCPRRRRHCLRRLLLIRRIRFQLFESTSSPQLAEAYAQTLHRRRSPEPRSRQRPLRHHLGFSSRSTFLISATLDTWCFRTTVSS